MEQSLHTHMHERTDVHEWTHTHVKRMKKCARTHTNVCVPLPAFVPPGGADGVPTGEGSETQKLSG